MRRQSEAAGSTVTATLPTDLSTAALAHAQLPGVAGGESSNPALSQKYLATLVRI